MKTGLKVIDAMTKQTVNVSPDKSVYECASMMRKEKVGSIIVSQRNKLAASSQSRIWFTR